MVMGQVRGHYGDTTVTWRLLAVDGRGSRGRDAARRDLTKTGGGF